MPELPAAIRLAGIAAVACVLESTFVVREVPFQRAVAPEASPVPFRLMVNAAPPGTDKAGVSAPTNGTACPVPLPVNGSVCDPVPALSAMVTAAEDCPSVGVHCTLMVQLAPTAIFEFALQRPFGAGTAKEYCEAFVPPIVIEEIARAAVPILVNVDVNAVGVVPTV